MTLNEIQQQQCDESTWDFSDLSVLFINCTLKQSPEVSNTQALADRSIAIMRRNGVEVDVVTPNADGTDTRSPVATIPLTGPRVGGRLIPTWAWSASRPTRSAPCCVRR